MLTQYAAASLVSENKVLTHPASVDSIPTGANTEDHVSMATAAGRKLLRVLHNSQATLAIELLVAAQAVEWRALAHKEPSPSESSVTFEELSVEATLGARDAAESQAKHFEALDPHEVRELLGNGTGAAYTGIRGAGVSRMVFDRPIHDSIRILRRLVERGQLLEGVNQALADSDQTSALRAVLPLSWRRPDSEEPG
jgi:histidine ammonia-lyase